MMCLPMQLVNARELQLKEIPVTANPLNLSSDEMTRPVHIMNGVQLTKQEKFLFRINA